MTKSNVNKIEVKVKSENSSVVTDGLVNIGNYPIHRVPATDRASVLAKLKTLKEIALDKLGVPPELRNK